MNSIEDHKIIIKNLIVYYRTAGDPKDPPLVLLNGWGVKVGGPILSSYRVIKELAQHNFYVLSPEHPGLMRSETPKTIWGPGEYVEYLEEFIQKLGLNNFILVGQSFGGAIATYYAAKHPENIKTLVLVSPGVSEDKRSHFAFRHLRAIDYLDAILRSKFVTKTIKKLVVALTLGVPWSFTNKESFETRSIMGKTFSNWRLPNVYARIQTRTILIWGRFDNIFPLSSAREIVTELPNAKLFIVTGGHSVLYTQPKKIVDLIVSKL